MFDCAYFKESYKSVMKGLSKQETLDVDSKAIKEINSTGNLLCAGNTAMSFIMEEVEETIMDFSQITVKEPQMSSKNLF